MALLWTPNTRARRAIRTVGGANNLIVERHPRGCQHCGFFGVPADAACERCGVRVHSQCIELREGRLCDDCAEGGRVANEVCALCQRPDPPGLAVDATDRLYKVLVLHGHEWEEEEEEEERDADAARLELDPDGAVARELSAYPHARFAPADLPEAGARPMRVRLASGVVLRSRPLVVHSWCALCLFQICPTRMTDWRASLVAEMLRRVRLPYGTVGRPVGRATHTTHACQFCGETVGWTTFCMHHMALTHPRTRGCDRCRAGAGPHECLRTELAFHPSCAVWAGMQRIGRHEGFGMICERPKFWRSRRLPRLRTALSVCPGINEFLVGFEDVDAMDLKVGEDVPRKGGRYARTVMGAPNFFSLCDAVSTPHPPHGTPPRSSSVHES